MCGTPRSCFSKPSHKMSIIIIIGKTVSAYQIKKIMLEVQRILLAFRNGTGEYKYII